MAKPILSCPVWKIPSHRDFAPSWSEFPAHSFQPIHFRFLSPPVWAPSLSAIGRPLICDQPGVLCLHAVLCWLALSGDYDAFRTCSYFPTPGRGLGLAAGPRRHNRAEADGAERTCCLDQGEGRAGSGGLQGRRNLVHRSSGCTPLAWGLEQQVHRGGGEVLSESDAFPDAAPSCTRPLLALSRGAASTRGAQSQLLSKLGRVSTDRKMHATGSLADIRTAKALFASSCMWKDSVLLLFHMHFSRNTVLIPTSWRCTAVEKTSLASR